MTKYHIVQLEVGCWVAPWGGEPGRTVNIENAERFKSRKAAECALADAREYRVFAGAFVDERTDTPETTEPVW